MYAMAAEYESLEELYSDLNVYNDEDAYLMPVLSPLPIKVNEWQFKNLQAAGGWETFDKNNSLKLEDKYSNVDTDACQVVLSTGPSNDLTCNDVAFDAMIMTRESKSVGKKDKRKKNSQIVIPIRRSCTLPTIHDMTTWIWYWKDEHDKWNEYQGEVTSSILERSYRESVTNRPKFQAGTQSYEIDFAGMKQTNTSSKVTRPIRRRPRISQSPPLPPIDGRHPYASLVVPTLSPMGAPMGPPMYHLRSMSPPISPPYGSMAMLPRPGMLPPPFYPVPPAYFAHPYHQHYRARMDLGYNSGSKYKLHKVDKRSNEFRDVAAKFTKTKKTKIETICKIRNPYLSEGYVRKRALMKAANGKEPKEEILFHGTSLKYIEVICEQGFDWRLSGTSTGTLYGQGSYFSRDASYAHEYAEGKMFMVNVLVGDTAKGDASMKRPPPKDESKPLENFYDACVDDTKTPSIYVVFDILQAYPSYIIEYSK